MNIRLLIPALLACSSAWSAPFAISDSVSFTPAPTHCGFFVDAAAKVVLPVAKDADGKPYCKKDLMGTVPGSHTITATFIIQDPIWGERESAKSVPLVFSAPGVPTGAPSTIKLSAE